MQHSGQDGSCGCIVVDTPPSMDGCQDMILTYKVSHEDLKEFRMHEGDIIREVEFIADSISPEGLCNNINKEFLQAKLDALLLTDEAYTWLYMNFRLAPKWIGPAKVFLKSLLYILQQEGVLANDGKP
ncbi:hypothetical protein, conserved [Eimeria maxima]|uniref:Uncharacterized protein n=1 Tax=Eimeria maxima TaxID=5804 RepID=U6M601_EIMMA|nr:hypothetical protein, conserved [Eimeria maxima]CDJ57070.1 hypothetical protein, conserved [Eimeria maxima]